MQGSLQFEKKMFWFKLKLSLAIIASWWLVAFFNMYLGFSLSKYSLQPHSFAHFYGLFTYPFIHGDLDHLMNNSLSAFMIFTSLFLIYEDISLKVLGIIYVCSGVLLWFIGETNSMHIGASSVIYGVAFFLMLSGFIVRESSNLAISFLLVAWYGSMVWGIFPYTVAEGISWEGHLSGAIVGVVLGLRFHWAYFFKQKPYLELEDDTEDFFFFEKYPIEENLLESDDETSPPKLQG